MLNKEFFFFNCPKRVHFPLLTIKSTFNKDQNNYYQGFFNHLLRTLPACIALCEK